MEEWHVRGYNTYIREDNGSVAKWIPFQDLTKRVTKKEKRKKYKFSKILFLIIIIFYKSNSLPWNLTFKNWIKIEAWISLHTLRG